MRTPGIPLLLTIALAASAVFGLVAGGAAISGNGMFPFMDAAWGGRSIGAGLVALLAILLRNPTAYLIAFVSSVPREIGDIIQFTALESVDWSIVGVTAVFLIFWIVGSIVAFRARV